MPAGVGRLLRDGVIYRPLDEARALTPIILSHRKDDRSPEIALVLKIIREMYRKSSLEFGA